jgi:hypothetical protein
VPLLIAIALVLAWGTMYETRFGTAAVQRFVYTAWWFQALLAFLAVNLAIAALSRLPWKRPHLPFVLAHLGIILILVGGILGGRFGIEGQLIIPEGEANRTLQLPTNILTVHLPVPPPVSAPSTAGPVRWDEASGPPLAGQTGGGTQASVLAAVLTGPAGERQVLEEVKPGVRYTHPWLGYTFQVAAYEPRAQVTQQITNRSDEVRAEMLHLVGREGEQTAEAWVGLRGSADLALGKAPVRVEYRSAQRDLPFTIKLLDFRKIDYPGISMAAGFESDVQLSDPQRGLILMRKISMNNPLRYRGFSFYQSSYIPGPTETTVLSVRSDPGTPVVYAGFLIVIAGVVSMFLQHPARPARSTIRKGRSAR